MLFVVCVCLSGAFFFGIKLGSENDMLRCSPRYLQIHGLKKIYNQSINTINTINQYNQSQHHSITRTITHTSSVHHPYMYAYRNPYTSTHATSIYMHIYLYSHTHRKKACMSGPRHRKLSSNLSIIIIMGTSISFRRK